MRGVAGYKNEYILSAPFSGAHLCLHHCARKAAAVAPFKKRNRFYENTTHSAVKLTTLSKILQNAKILLRLGLLLQSRCRRGHFQLTCYEFSRFSAGPGELVPPAAAAAPSLASSAIGI